MCRKKKPRCEREKYGHILQWQWMIRCFILFIDAEHQPPKMRKRQHVFWQTLRIVSQQHYHLKLKLNTNRYVRFGRNNASVKIIWTHALFILRNERSFLSLDIFNI